VATNRIHIAAPPEKVFRLLATGDRYADWVVGAKRVRSVDAGWPQPGSSFHHTVGVGLVSVDDRTTVVAHEPPRRLVLDAGVGPVGRARVEFVVEPDGDGSRVEMIEDVVTGPEAVRRVADPVVEARNAEALRRLRELCEGRGGGG
jgi:uncharacterized protein YndB with AHSA1/START domain